jgi:hypothetical protein
VENLLGVAVAIILNRLSKVCQRVSDAKGMQMILKLLVFLVKYLAESK